VKKLLTILTLALVLCMVFSIASAEVKYGAGYTVNVSGDTATVAADPTITIEGKTYTTKGVDVVYSGAFPASLTLSRTPANCGKEIDVFVKYDYDASKTIIKADRMKIFDHVLPAKPETVITEPTCTADGKGIYKCTKCGELVEAKINKLGHDLVEYVTLAPTCEKDGTAEKRCTRCDYVSPEYALEGTHVWEQIFVAPECEKGKLMTEWEKTGYSYWQCATCGAYAKTVTENPDKTFTADIKAELKDAKTDYATLALYNAAAPVDTDGHEWSVWHYAEATCVAPGYKVRWCTRCDSNETKAIDTTDPEEYQDDIKKKDIVWDVALRDGYLACSFDPAKDYGKGKAAYVYCTVCGGKYHAFSAIGTPCEVEETTTFGSAAVKQTYNLTYTAPTDMKKANMTAIFTVGTEKIPALMCHVYIYDVAHAVKTTTPAGAVVPYEKGLSCDSNGVTEYFCVNDTASINANKNGSTPATFVHALGSQVTTKKLGHIWGEWIEMYAPIPGVEDSGWWHRKCTREYVEDIHTGKKVKCTAHEDNHGNQFPCTEHTPAFVVVTPATCEAEGVQKKVCEKCGVALPLEADETTVIPAAGHDWAEEIVIEPTCTKAGASLKTCKVCGKAEKGEVEALGHKWDEGKVTKEATKEVKGDKTYTCTVCGETKVEEGVVDYVVTAKPAYTLEDVALNGDIVTGKLVHVDDTLEADQKGIRVTFYNGNTYITVAAQLYADGSFEAQGAGAVEHITIAAYATEKVVNPAGLNEDNWFGSKSIDVK